MQQVKMERRRMECFESRTDRSAGIRGASPGLSCATTSEILVDSACRLVSMSAHSAQQDWSLAAGHRGWNGVLAFMGILPVSGHTAASATRATRQRETTRRAGEREARAMAGSVKFTARKIWRKQYLATSRSLVI